MSRRLHLASIVLCAAAASVPAAEGPSPLARLYDAPGRSGKPLDAAALTGKAGWKRIPEGNVTHRFSGHAILLNGKLAVVVQPKTGGIAVYSIAAGAVSLRASVACIAGRSSTATGIEKLGIAENASSAAAVAVSFGGSDSATVTLRLTTGQGILEIQPGRRASALDVVTRARYVVVPDFFGDDWIMGPGEPRQVDLPAENFFLNLVEGGNAIVMCVWQPRRLSASATIAKAGRCANRIDLAKGKSVWLAFLEGTGIWHEGRPGGGPKPGWKPPFAAKWRYSQPRKTGFAVSWEGKRGQEKRGQEPFRDSVTPLIGASPPKRFLTPFSLTPFSGPVVVYPIDRVLATPLTVFCPTDVLRNTLGVGPCEHILATEGLATPTNPTPDNVMTWLQRQLQRRRGRPSAEEIRKRLREMTAHSAAARTRIMQYRDLASAVLAMCKDNAPVPPSAAGLPATAERIRKTVAEGILAIGHVEGVERLAAELPALADKPDAAARCEPLAMQLRAIGAAQSRTLSRCRAAALWLRQQCVMAARAERKVLGLAGKIQDRVERVLK